MKIKFLMFGLAFLTLGCSIEIKNKVRQQPDLGIVKSDLDNDASSRINLENKLDSSISYDSSPRDSEILPVDCLAFYRMESSDYLRNECGLDYTLEDHGSTSASQGRHFDGSSYLLTTNFPPLTRLTVEALVKPDLTSHSYRGAYGSIVHAAVSPTDTGIFEGWYLIINEREEIEAKLNLNGAQNAIATPYSFPTDRFTKVRFEYDGINLRLKANDRLLFEIRASGIIVPSRFGTGIGNEYIGRDGFIGTIDDVIITGE